MTIEQRASNFASVYPRCEQKSAKDCYTIGAIAQRDIDIERAVSWLETELNGGNIEGCKDSEKLIEELKQAMRK